MANGEHRHRVMETQEEPVGGIGWETWGWQGVGMQPAQLGAKTGRNSSLAWRTNQQTMGTVNEVRPGGGESAGLGSGSLVGGWIGTTLSSLSQFVQTECEAPVERANEEERRQMYIGSWG